MKFADIYVCFEVNTTKVKSSHQMEMTFEKKKKRAEGFAESILNECVTFLNNLRSVVNVEKMCRLCNDFCLSYKC